MLANSAFAYQLNTSTSYTPASNDRPTPGKPLAQTPQSVQRLPIHPAQPFQVHSGQALLEDQKHYRQTQKHWDPLDTSKLDKSAVVHLEHRIPETNLSKINTGTDILG